MLAGRLRRSKSFIVAAALFGSIGFAAAERFVIGGQPNAGLPGQIVVVLEQDDSTEKLFTKNSVNGTARIAKTAKLLLQIA